MYKKIVGIIGVPRSGTSWLGQIFDSAPDVLYRMQPFYSWAFRDKIHVRSSKREINDFFCELYLSNDSYLKQQERKKSGIYPIFNNKKSQPEVMVYKEVMFHYLIPILLKHVDQLKIIALVRHPVDVLTSYYNAPREFDPTLDIQKEWYFAQNRNELLPERYFGYHKWKEYMKLISIIQEKYPKRVIVIRYEDLAKNPECVVQQLFQYTDISYEKQSEQFIIDSQSSTVDDPYSVFRNKSELRFRNKLPSNIIIEIKQDLQSFDEAKKYKYE